MSEQNPEIKNVVSNDQLRKIIVVLVVFSLLIIIVRLVFQDHKNFSSGDRIWHLTVDISAIATNENLVLKLFPPIDTPHIQTIERKVYHPGFQLNSLNNNKTSDRSLTALSSKKGIQNIIVEFFLHESQQPMSSRATNKQIISTQNRELYLTDSQYLDISSDIVQETVKKLLSKQANQKTLINQIFNLVSELPLNINQDQLNVASILTTHKASTLDRSLVMVSLSRAANIPARMVSGLILKEDIEPQLHYWVEIYHDNEWQSYDVLKGYQYTLPANYLPIHRNALDIVQVVKGELKQIDLDIEQEFRHPFLSQSTGNKNLLTVFDLSRLPIDIRSQLAILLLLPFGTLITAIFRHLIGMHSYGVFTPTLLALALVYSDPLTTLIIFFTTCSLAIAGRSLMPAKLSLTPRLSIIFTLITIIMALSVSLMAYFGLTKEGNVFLLPIVILTSLVDRFYRTQEENGIEIAVRRLIWTIIIGLLCLPVVQFETLGNRVLQYPEVHFITLALFLLISTYKGKQLVDLPIIRLLAEPINPVPEASSTLEKEAKNKTAEVS